MPNQPWSNWDFNYVGGGTDRAILMSGDFGALINRIRQIFLNRGVPIGTPTESEAARLNRIAQEVLSGSRTLQSVRNSVDWIANNIGTTPNIDPADPNDHGQDPGPGNDYGANPNAPSEPTPAPVDFRAVAASLFPYLPAPLLNIFVEEYTNNGGNSDLALAKMRQSREYEIYYPGNRRSDGTLIYDEQAYARQVDGYRQVLRYYDIPASVFEQQFGRLIAGNVDAAEFQRRVDLKFVQVASASTYMQEVYSRYYGIDVSMAALIAAAMDPSKNLQQIQLEISRAQIGAEADAAGFTGQVDLADATRLMNAGMTQEAARNFYRQARSLMPKMTDLIARNNDPDDDFSLDSLTEAVIFMDPAEQFRMKRNFAQEESRFTRVGSVREDQQGRMVGLEVS